MDKYESGFIKTPTTRIFCGVTYNVYDRFTLYEEVWSYPLTTIAEKYMITGTGLKKLCVSMRIPTPPTGYWSKVRAGKHPRKTPLPDPNVNFQKEGMRPAYIEEKLENGKIVRKQLKKSDVEKADIQNRHKANTIRSAEYREKFNAEVLHLSKVLKQAENYETACMLRKYAGALMENGDDKEVDWILAKADLYDPTVSIIDPVLGKTIPPMKLK